ncbi:sulfatase family protein [Aureibacillus halotolerans]|uniref:Choline-sulfatase n=1 Tax=Aureibacillus halotolerans TaxID=1508390 RepID=A0A4R6TWH3_9BACI|nr:sulfatase-like hydrolase/transferase [Aureibacillus halotolerans]TDQ36603.1 choline-sulfatase [Aureibacillus halotolerans]
MRPNILWICTDQQRFDTLGCYGNEFVKTPNIDRLAEKGVLFEKCYSQSPVCTPSRASFLTGRYPQTNCCRQNGQAIPKNEVLVTKILADAGYTCGLSGKLHLSPCHPSVAPVIEPRIDDGYAQFHWSHHPGPDWPTNEYTQWLRAKGQSYKPQPMKECRHVSYGPDAEHHQTTWCAEKAVQFFEDNQNEERPWLFSVNMFDPHHPFDPPQQYMKRYLERLEDIPLPNFTEGELGNKPVYQRTDHEGAYGMKGHLASSEMDEKDHRMLRAAYWAMIDLIDEQVGRMIDSLEETGQLENTIIIFMSDHGELLGDHGIYLKGPHFYEPSIRVPFIMSWPEKIRGNQRIDRFVELIDLAPTLLEAAGEPVYEGMQGQSLWDVLVKEDADYNYRDDVYCEHYNANFKHGTNVAYATMLRTEKYKLVVYHGETTGELYHLDADPNETINVWHQPEHQTIKLSLYQRLCDRMAQTADPLPIRQSPW